MKNKTIYIRLIVSFVAMLILSYVISSISIYPLLEKQNDLYHENSIFEQTTFDFLVPQPSDSQIDDFISSDDYSKVVPFYMFKSDLEANDHLIEYNLILIENFDDLKDTPYTDERAIIKEDLSATSIAIDYTFSKLANVGIGDKVQINLSSSSQIELTVDAIYENNNSIFESAIVALFDGEIKDFIVSSRGEDNPLSYHGAYLTAVDQELAWQGLSNYQPLASLRSRDEFTSDLAYQTYLDLFNTTDYTTQIYNKDEQANEKTDLINDLNAQINKQYIMTSVMIIVSFGIILLITMIYTVIDIRSRKISINLFNEIKTYNLIIWLSSIIFIIGILIFGGFYKYNTDYQSIYYSSIFSSRHLIISIVSLLIISVLGIIIIYFISKPKLNNKRTINNQSVTMLSGNKKVSVKSSQISIGDIIYLKKDELVLFSGKVIEGNAVLKETNSKDKKLNEIKIGDRITPGFIVLKGNVKVKVTRL